MTTGQIRADDRTEGAGKRGRRFTWLRTDLCLLVAGLVLGLVALYLYPGDAPLAGSEALQGVAVFADFTPSAVVAEQTPLPQVNGFRLEVVVHNESSEPAVPNGIIKIALPGDTWGSYVRCRAPAYYCGHDSAGLKQASYPLPHRWVYAGSNVPASDRYELRFTVVVSGVGSNLSRNAEYVVVLTPPIAFMPLGSTDADYVPVQSVYAEQVPDDSYSWSVGSTPAYISGFDRWTFTSAKSLQDAASPTLNSGTDLAVQSRNGNKQFFAGIVLGVAGGALIGSIPEFFNRRREAAREDGAALP